MFCARGGWVRFHLTGRDQYTRRGVQFTKTEKISVVNEGFQERLCRQLSEYSPKKNFVANSAIPLEPASLLKKSLYGSSSGWKIQPLDFVFLSTVLSRHDYAARVPLASRICVLMDTF